MEEVEDEEAGSICRYVEDYGRSAGHIYGEGQSQFVKWREAQKKVGHASWSPYNELDEWDLSQWLIHNVGQNATDEYLKLNQTFVQKQVRVLQMYRHTAMGS